jgi:competence protein ComGC
MKNGFTLIEMLIVMMAVTLLIMITIPNVTKTVSIIENTGCKSQLSLVDSAILQYKLEHERYPVTMEDLIEGGLIKEEHRICQNGKEIVIDDNQAIIK